MKRMSKSCITSNRNFYRIIYCTLQWKVGKWFHLKRGGLVMNGYRPCWFLHTMSYKQTRLASVRYKDSSLKVLFTFQVWARFFCRSMYFFVFVFPYLLYECVPCHTYGLLTKCEIMMAGYWPSSFFACLWTETKSRSINSQKKNKANIQPSWPNKLGQ